MSLIPHTFFPRRFFDMDTWMEPSFLGTSPYQTTSLFPSALDLFDPFDELDRMMSRNLRWLTPPETFFPGLEGMMPKVPQKYRITLDCAGYSPESIKTEMKEANGQRNIIITGHQEKKTGEENYSTREFKRSFTLPLNAEYDKMVSFMTPAGKYVIEVPLKTTMPSALLPQIVDMPGGGKGVSLQLNVPPNIDPSKINVSIKDRDLIVNVQDEKVTPDATSKVYYYHRSVLPENCDFNALKCIHDKGQLTFTAPLSSQPISPWRNVSIETPGQQQQIKSS